MKLIDKDALLSEIEEKIMQYEAAFNNPSFASYEACLIAKGKYRKLLDILQFINTLEVKDVDSRLTFEDISILRQIMFDYDRQVSSEMSFPSNEDYCKEVLKRFKAQK